MDSFPQEMMFTRMEISVIIHYFEKIVSIFALNYCFLLGFQQRFPAGGLYWPDPQAIGCGNEFMSVGFTRRM